MNINTKIIKKLVSEYSNTEFEIKDEEFDEIYPEHIYNISDVHWTPVKVAIKAASLLVDSPGTRVLDIGSGAGKFCLIGALTTEGHFTGVEYRKSLVDLSNRIISEFNLKNIEIIHSNMEEINFTEYDAFYFFNAFYEHTFDIETDVIIDSSVELSDHLFKQYTASLYKKFETLDSGKKIVTYCGWDIQIPNCYELKYADFDNTLKLWIKI